MCRKYKRKTKEQSQKKGRFHGLLLPLPFLLEQHSRSLIPSYNSIHNLSPVPFPFPWTASRHDLVPTSFWLHYSFCLQLVLTLQTALISQIGIWLPSLTMIQIFVSATLHQGLLYAKTSGQMGTLESPLPSLLEIPFMGKAGSMNMSFSRELGPGYAGPWMKYGGKPLKGWKLWGGMMWWRGLLSRWGGCTG